MEVHSDKDASRIPCNEILLIPAKFDIYTKIIYPKYKKKNLRTHVALLLVGL